MKLLEYEAKALLSKQKIAIPSFVLIRENTHVRVPFPSVLKSQVPVGGRGKAGGVKIVETQVELKSATPRIIQIANQGLHAQNNPGGRKNGDCSRVLPINAY